MFSCTCVFSRRLFSSIFVGRFWLVRSGASVRSSHAGLDCAVTTGLGLLQPAPSDVWRERRVQESRWGRAAWTDGREKGTLSSRDARVNALLGVSAIYTCNMPIIPRLSRHSSSLSDGCHTKPYIYVCTEACLVGTWQSITHTHT